MTTFHVCRYWRLPQGLNNVNFIIECFTCVWIVVCSVSGVPAACRTLAAARKKQQKRFYFQHEVSFLFEFSFMGFKNAQKDLNFR